MSGSGNRGLWAGVAAAVIAVAALIWLLTSGAPHTLVILFPETGDLKKDDAVVWHGYVVGKVQAIEPLVDNQVGVTIRLNEDYGDRITFGSRFSLRRASLFGLVGSNSIEVETPAQAGRPYEKGERIQGTAPPPATLVEQGKEWTLEYWNQLKSTSNDLLEEYRKSPYRKEVEAALQQLSELAAKASSLAKEELTRFRSEHQKDIDSVRKQLEQARDWLRKQGDDAGARRIQEEIDKLIGK
jgi:ABC-type transporter Mla subunit MlaD